MSVYNTHIPVLNTILKNFNIKNVFEFGSGFGSTPIFVKKCECVHSVEMQDELWFDKVKKELALCNNFIYDLVLGPTDAIDYFINLDKTYDLVFVDGHGSTRPECINAAFNKTNIVVTHDTETVGYRWERINMPQDWARIDYKILSPWTTIFHKKNIDVTELKKELNI